jgi:hypothetical protein
MANKLFSDLVNFSRGTGATRVNSAGLIVGVDFSVTSNTITTGSKTFTLAADANVNRDWPVGSNVIAVAQAGATGSMTGTVTSYTPSTQSLVINVVSVTGSGTSTDWRIGSLEMREDYDPVTLVRRGVLSEVAATNLSFNTADFFSQQTTSNEFVSPDGSSNADLVVSINNTLPQTNKIVSFPQVIPAGTYTYSIHVYLSSAWANPLTHIAITIINAAGNSGIATPGIELNNIARDRWVRVSFTFTLSQGSSGYQLNRDQNINKMGYLWGDQFEASLFPTSYIPTTSAQVTRNADNFPLTAAALTSIRQGESTLYAEIDCPDTGVAQKRALRLSGVNADIRIGKQGTGTLSNFTKMAEGAGLRLMGTASNLIRGNGQEMLPLVTAIDQRSGTATTSIPSVNAVAFDGVNRFAISSGSEEIYLDNALSVFSGRGSNGIEIRGAHHNGNRFLAASGGAGIVFVSDGTSYRRVNTPVITQPTNEITSGLVGGTLRNVIVGQAGFIATSDDQGETWTARTSGTGGNLNGASFGSIGGTNYFIAVGNGTVRYSTDAITWLSATGTTGNLIDIHIANNIAVAVNSVGLIFTSTNGTSFTQATNSNTTNVLAGVTYAASLNLWVACGSGGTIVTASNPSGTWTLQSSGVLANLNEVGIFNNAIYVVGDNQTLLTSTNGTSYTSLTAGVSGALIGIAASPTTLLITGSAGAMASSTDGTTFTSRTNNNQVLNGIAFGNNTFVSVGNSANGSGYIATIGADGTVTRRVSGTTSNLREVKFLNGLFVGGTNSAGHLVTSTDGVTWTSRTVAGTATDFNGLAFGGGLYVAVGTNGRFTASQDGITWDTVSANDRVFPGRAIIVANGLDFSNGIFVAVGTSGNISTGVVSGTTVVWTLRTSGTTANLNSVMFSQRDQLWYAAGNGGVLLYSPDAITWTAVQNSGTASILGTTLQSNQPLPQFKSGVNKIALSYKQNQVIAALNGVTSTSDTAATIPVITAASIAENLNGYIKDVIIYKDAMTTAEIVARTL